ncbi:alpha/beta hydrolase [Mesorhizobium sp. B2-4-8]|uniref:alpha/beta fold hydrolase n=1 Tax=Mesorhizobium sp. B2-4-8 TaxID=2589941 RepID=UPI00112C2699|nr:alpha/beta hydrolase [Mesorhizobium sp. B2-4-8]TPL35573.1 alpha/beta hydrolase [Mesorhizobium sp. B2-4-8]
MKFVKEAVPVASCEMGGVVGRRAVQWSRANFRLARLKHSQISVNGGGIHVAETGLEHQASVLFLHGWPQDWSAWAPVLEMAGEHVHALAIDLPGIGKSNVADPPSKPHDIADMLHDVVKAMGREKLAIVGHDIGGQVAYAYLRRYSAELEAAAILDVVIPGIPPWEKVRRNPSIWHFAFHATPRLPDLLVSGNERAYFNFFYDALAKHAERITPQARAAYARAYASPAALRAEFDWYRAFSQAAALDEADGQAPNFIETPLLYIRGADEPGDIDFYLDGFRSVGIRSIRGATIADCGHFVPEEQPAALCRALLDFLRDVGMI